jgi:hypothetical protein
VDWLRLDFVAMRPPCKRSNFDSTIASGFTAGSRWGDVNAIVSAAVPVQAV